MVGIGRLVVIVLVTAHTGIGRRIIIPVVALIAIGDVCMGPGQCIVIAMRREGCRFPSRVCCMTGSAGRCNAVVYVIRVGRLVIGIDMTGGTIGRCAGEAICMAGAAKNRCMSPGKRKSGVVVVESALGTSGGMAGIAGQAVVLITANAVMGIVHIRLVMGMAIDTGEDSVVRRVGMAIGAEGPGTLVFPGIDREILAIVIKSSRLPGSRIMTGLAVGTELCRSMIGIICIVIIRLVTAYAIRRKGIVVNSVMTLVATDRGMCSRQGIIVIMDGEGSRFPSGIRSMAIGTCRIDAGSLVVRIRCGIIIGQVTGNTFF